MTSAWGSQQRRLELGRSAAGFDRLGRLAGVVNPGNLQPGTIGEIDELRRRVWPKRKKGKKQEQDKRE